ncbi:Phosphatidylinositol 4-kinase beta [Echinococcus granulosus]|uniref:Phosphatidylinositol 4-kinase beta n=1 Tax=Echinococcus granulosus TaxID=6210 RepID=A0A068WX30_ECHGR|nr:Phosphatidylinositol 4-kinase beta [Echinococcus granulosus]CDS22261.1 phosphatidylinositol 4 kinase beta [Echinococcus granulosus]
MTHQAPSLLIMNSLHSPHSVKTFKPLAAEMDEQNTEVHLPKLPLSPSMIGRACPGQAALANSTSNTNSLILSSSPPFSSLMRFINSSVFSVHHAVHYLNEGSASKDWDYLVAKRLFEYRTEDVDFYLPQLVVLFLQCDGPTRSLLPYLFQRVKTSLRFATEMAWLVDAHNISSHSTPNSPFKPLKSYPIDFIPAVTTTTSSSTIEVAKEVEEESGSSGSLNGSLNCLEMEDNEPSIVKQTQTSTAVEKGDQLMKHKRAASDLTCLANGSEAQSRDQAEASNDSCGTAFGSEAGNHADVDDDLESPEAFDGSKPTRSEAWIEMHSRFYDPAASRSDTHLHLRRPRLLRATTFTPASFSTDLLGLPEGQNQQPGRLQDALTDFLDAGSATAAMTVGGTSKQSLRSDKLIGLCQGEWDFMNALLSISHRLAPFASKEQRTSHLQAELGKLNFGLPARVWLPVEATEHIVLRIPPSAAVCLNSAEKVPYLVYMEILVCNDVMTTRLPQRPGTATGFTHCNNPSCHSYDINSPQLTPASSKTCLTSARAFAAPDVISLFSTDSGESLGACVSSMTATPAVVAAGASNEDPTTTTSTSRSKHQQRDKNEPTVCYVNAKDIRRRLEQNAACQPQRTFKLDPEDPSAAVLKEPWELKARRIQEASPWGHLPGWQLAAVIVKVGDDLRQEQLAYQLLSYLKKIWADYHLNLWLRPLNIVITSPDSGLVEVVKDTVSFHQIRRHARLSLRDYIIREHGQPNSEGFLSAQRNFVQSCAAYCLVGYLLQVKDRHNGNILIDKEGHVVHIDYGFMLSASPGRNICFESSPFKLTAEQVELMGGVGGDMFNYYKSLIVQGLLAARKHMDELLLLVKITHNGYPHLPCFVSRGGARTLEALRQRFMLGSTDEQITRCVEYLICQSLNSLTTRLYDNYQYYANGIQ